MPLPSALLIIHCNWIAFSIITEMELGPVGYRKKLNCLLKSDIKMRTEKKSHYFYWTNKADMWIQNPLQHSVHGIKKSFIIAS